MSTVHYPHDSINPGARFGKRCASVPCADLAHTARTITNSGFLHFQLHLEHRCEQPFGRLEYPLTGGDAGNLPVVTKGEVVAASRRRAALPGKPALGPMALCATCTRYRQPRVDAVDKELVTDEQDATNSMLYLLYSKETNQPLHAPFI
jgi:hypothetical protein